jgi:hypothetical protein
MCESPRAFAEGPAIADAIHAATCARLAHFWQLCLLGLRDFVAHPAERDTTLLPEMIIGGRNVFRPLQLVRANI